MTDYLSRTLPDGRVLTLMPLVLGRSRLQLAAVGNPYEVLDEW